MDTDFCDTGFTHLLDDISEAFVSNDFSLWKKRILLPFSMITKDGPIILESQDELKGNFEQYFKACTLSNVDKIYRVPISLESCQDGTWLGTYKTFLLTANANAIDPYISSTLIKITENGPRMISIMNARGHHDWVGQHPLVATYGKSQ